MRERKREMKHHHRNTHTHTKPYFILLRSSAFNKERTILRRKYQLDTLLLKGKMELSEDLGEL